jgi:hypothetical protein
VPELVFARAMKLLAAVLLAVFAIAGCASQRAGERSGEGLADAALSPLDDLNLRRSEIPPLLAALDSPYQLNLSLSCEQIAASIAELDAVLGPDWDAPKPDERLRTEVLTDEAAKATLGAVESGVTGWIPFRGLVRKATGAESHENKYNRAFKIGAQRRTYLKGYGLAKGCDMPARPDFETMTADDTAAVADPK